MTAPPTTSLWPLRYFVVECTTMSAPSASGRCQPGDRNVLSATTSAPIACARLAMSAMSVMRSSGLLGVSIHTRRAGFDSAASTAASSPKLTNSTSSSPRLLPRVEQAERAAVAVVRRDDARAHGQQMADERDGAHAGAGDDPARAAFEIGERLGQQVARRIARAAVVVLAFVAEAAEREGRREMERRHDRTRHVAAFEARAHGAGVQGREVVIRLP